MSIAECSLVLDNSSGIVEERGPEISVTRRVYKGGEGEYLIDGQKVRLKDVREMLFGTGLGSRGYSVLEQGKIDAVLSANPIDRRRIFEEAAGIGRFLAGYGIHTCGDVTARRLSTTRARTSKVCCSVRSAYRFSRSRSCNSLSWRPA